jgi:U3 small nucleolar RNA-associated protein 13
VALQDYKNAIFLALSMDHPRRLYNLFNVVSNSRVFETFMDDETGEILGNIPSSSITGNPAVDEVLRTLPFAELAKLLRYVRDWNTTARTSGVAQVILHAIVKLRPASDIHAAFNHRPVNFLQNDPETKEDSAVKQGEGLRDVMDALIPYTERHLDRTDRLVQESYILDLLLSEMDGGMGLDDEPMEVDVY